jgi:cytochrome c556
MMTGALLAAGIWSLAGSNGYSADDDKEDVEAIQNAQKAVLELTDAMKSGKSGVKDQAEAIHKKFDELKPIMYVFKPRAKKGVGIGPQGPRDGIEFRFQDLGNTKKISDKALPGVIKDMKDELIKGAQITKGVAEITDLYVPKKMPEDWKKYTQDMRKSSDDLIDALQKGNPARVRAAANNLNSSCNQCHTDFRD